MSSGEILLPDGRKSLEPWIHDWIEYEPWQVEGVRELCQRSSFLLGDDMGLGKLNPYSEPILTPDGWTEMGKLSVGDQVIGSSGQATDVTHIFEQGQQEIVKVTFSDGSWSRCSWDHLWQVNTPVRKYRNAAPLVLTTRELLARGLTEKNTNNKWYIPIVRAVEFSERTAPIIDPYAMGVLLGDGALSSHGAAISTDDEIVESLLLPEAVEAVAFASCGEHGSAYRMNGLAKYLRKYNLMGKRSEAKFIPDDYKWGSIATRIAVLQGLLDTDGTAVQSRGGPSATIEYRTVSDQLCQDVKHIVLSLGGLVSVTEKTPTYSYKGESGLEGQLFYRMVLRLPEWLVPFRLERKLARWTPRSKYEPTRAIVSIEPDGQEEARCIRVSANDHLYVTRDFIVTHNSLQALTVFAVDVIRGWCETMLIVCPATIKGNWCDEICKFTRFPHLVLDGAPKDRNKQLLQFMAMEGPKILIINYEQVAAHLDTLDSMKFDVALFDEAHYLKNPKSKRTKACLNLYSRRSFMLTGTPMLNHVNELWSILHKITPREFPNYYSFLNRYAVFGGYKDKQIIGVKNEKELTERLQSYMIRRLKDDVMDRTKPTPVERRVDLSPEQKKLYDAVVEDMRLPRADQADPDDIENALTKFLRLKQICGTTLPFSGEDHSGKLDVAVADAIELMENGRKIIVFTQFRDVQAAFCQRLDAEAPQFDIWELHGGIKNEDRQPTVNDWSKDPKPGAIVCMLQVAGIGLNMVAASDVLFLDELFVPGLNKQALDRADRIGQTRPVVYYKYITRGTIENRVQAILKTKSKLFGEIVETDPDWKRKLYKAMLEGDQEES